MRILGWNCRGICNSSTVHTLRALIRGQNPVFVFLCETKASEDRMKKVANLIGFPHFCAIDPKGRAGGICMFWAKELDVELLEFNSNTIAVTIKDCTCV
jgi:exonuclease III